jgi:hypothetical protein
MMNNTVSQGFGDKTAAKIRLPRVSRINWSGKLPDLNNLSWSKKWGIHPSNSVANVPSIGSRGLKNWYWGIPMYSENVFCEVECPKVGVFSPWLKADSRLLWICSGTPWPPCFFLDGRFHVPVLRPNMSTIWTFPGCSDAGHDVISNYGN